MNEYRIEKVRSAVQLRLVGGRVIDGDLFVQPTARFHAGPQHPAELLNESEPFVPVGMADETILIAKDQIAAVQVSAFPADTGIDGVAEADVELTLADGFTVSGTLRLETRADRPRLLDFLNDDHQRFLMLRSPGRSWLVHRRHIAFARHRR